jgi:RimJ/RimL family protein N-acetyltransferase
MPNPLLLEPLALLESERLLLRTPGAGDGQVLFEAVTESIADLRRFLGSVGWVAAEPSVEASELFCRTAVANFHARSDFPYLLFDRSTAKLVGVCGLHRPEWSTPRLEVGYWCRSSATGHGYATEAVERISAYAFRHLRAARVEAITDEENAASRRVVERSGFSLEGVLRSHRRAADGSLRNMCVYARLPTAESS